MIWVLLGECRACIVACFVLLIVLVPLILWNGWLLSLWWWFGLMLAWLFRFDCNLWALLGLLSYLLVGCVLSILIFYCCVVIGCVIAYCCVIAVIANLRLLCGFPLSGVGELLCDLRLGLINVDCWLVVYIGYLFLFLGLNWDFFAS